MATYNEQMLRIWRKYGKEVTQDPASPRIVAAWAIENGHWTPHPSNIVTQCAEGLSKALREDYRIDSLGRKYRAKHSVRESKDGEQTTLWADMDLASRNHMETSFSQRRRGIVGDCVKLKTDVDVYNTLYSENQPFQMVLDFSMDVQEMQASI